MRYQPFNTTFRTLEDVAVFFEKNYKPDCIQQGEAPNDAHRRAGVVTLAQRTIATIRKTETEDGDDGDNSVEVG